MSPEFDAIYSSDDLTLVPPEMLLKALLLQIFFIRCQDDDSDPHKLAAKPAASG